MKITKASGQFREPYVLNSTINHSTVVEIPLPPPDPRMRNVYRICMINNHYSQIMSQVHEELLLMPKFYTTRV